MSALALFVALIACDSTGSTDTAGASCAACLDGGGTWQPEADECTVDCDIQDISCFRDECPGACAADNCGDCFDQGACQSAGCAWRQQDEAMWCANP